MAVDLWEFQKQAKNYLLNSNTPYGALWLGVGCGKTRTTLSLIEDKDFKKVLVLVSKKGVAAWVKEAHKLGYAIPVYDVTIGSGKARVAAIRGLRGASELIMVLNYDALTMPIVWEELRKWEFDAVVADEAQRIGGHGSKRSLLAAQINTEYKLALSGTPFQDRPLDVFGIARFLHPMRGTDGKLHSHHFGTWTGFKHQYAVWRGEYDVILVGYKNIPNIARTIDSFSYFIDRHEVLDLPPEIYSNEYVNFEPKARKLYDTLEKEFVIKLENGDKVTAERTITKLLRLQQMAGGSLETDEGEMLQFSTAKAERLAELIEEIGFRPVVVFYRFNTDMANIQLRLKHRNLYYINGKYNQQDAWEQDPAGVVLVQMAAGSEAIDLTHSAHCIYYSLDWSMGKYQQSVGRISRPTQIAAQTTYIHLLVYGTVDEDIIDAIKEKGRVVNGILRGLGNRYGRSLGDPITG